MRNIYVIVVFLSIFKVCVSLDHVWHPYLYNPLHESREELVITNMTSDDRFRLDYIVSKWKSLRVEKTCYLVGMMERNVAVASIKLNTDKNGLLQESYLIELEEKPTDVALFQYWNSSLQNSDVMLVVATQKPELLWYRISETSNAIFWSWPMHRNISHINVFQIDYDYQLLIITQHLSHTTADIYEFELKEIPNFWLRQNLELTDFARSSSFAAVGPDYFIALPQKSRSLLLVYKLIDNHFLQYQNLSSRDISEVITFKVGHKSFLAFNGINAGIYRFTKTGLVKESVKDSHLDGVNYWLPIPVPTYDNDAILIAQRSLDHGGHKSFVIEMITYNGDKFEEHEDIRCLYFGEDVLGLSCLPDGATETGIEGSASILLEDTLALVVPRKNRLSDVFFVKTELKKISNPLEKQLQELIEKKRYINNLITIQEELYKQYEARPRQSSTLDEMKAQLDKMEAEIKEMKPEIDSMKNFKHFDTVTFNGIVEIKSDGIFEEVYVENIKGTKTNTVIKDIVLKKDVGPISSVKTFANLEVVDLVFGRVNGIYSGDLLFAADNITISGEVSFEQPLTVSENVVAELVNDMKFENEIIDLESAVDELIFQNVEILGDVAIEKLNNNQIPDTFETKEFNPFKFQYENFFVPVNIEVVNVNGKDFNEFLEELCLTNLAYHIPGTIHVKGNVTVEDQATVDYLNDLEFPKKYVFMDDNHANLTGRKIFTNTVTTSHVNCDDVDGISPANVFGLTTNQTIPGTMTFKNLIITESLAVKGKILGEDASKFLPNPTLLDTDLVKANVHFKNLEVEGVIVVSNNFNGQNYESLLGDIVYTDEEEPVIEAMKQFPEGFTVRKNLLISSNTINKVSLDSFVTKDTDQHLNLSTINGVVTFGSVDTEGLYNSVDVKKLDEELVKLDGEQYISSTLNFEDMIQVNRLEILNSINDIRKDEVFYAHRNPESYPIRYENIYVEGNVYGDIAGIDLKEFDRSRMSFSKNQVIETEFNISNLNVDNIILGEVNGVNSYYFKREALEETLTTKLLEGKLEIKNLHVKNSVEVDQINNRSAINMGGSFWRNDVKKYNLSSLVFNNNVYFEDIEIEKLSGVGFHKYLSNFVFKNETDVTLSGRKVFLKGLTVEKLIETEKLNGVVLSNILTRHGEQEIVGPLTIQGDATLDNITIEENINNIPLKFITDTYKVTDGQFEIKGDMLFNRLPHIYNLQIQGHVDNKPVQEVLDGIVYKDSNVKLQGGITFENDVNIENNIRVIGKINNVDLPGFVSDMVMVTKDTTIQSQTQFVDPVFVQDSITVHEDLDTQDLNGIDLKSWVEEAIFVDKGFLEGNYIFEDITVVDNLQTDYINDIDMSTLIPLRSQQNLTELTFNEVSLFKDISVGNSTNFHNLPDEFANSVLTNSDEDIDSDVEFLGKVFIEGDMELLGLLNEVDTNRIVTTTTNQQLEAVYNFKSKINLEKNLLVEGLANGINVTLWARDSVKISSIYPQNITDDWFIEQNLILEDDATGNGLIGGADIAKLSQEIQDKRNYKYAVEKEFIDDYENMCKDLSYMYDRLKRQIYKFNYLEDLQMLTFQNEIEFVYHYEYRNNLYVLINEKNECESHLFKFDSHFDFVKRIDFGPIAQIISVHDNDLMYLVVRNKPFYSTCKVQGTNLWQLKDNDFVRLLSVEDQEVLQESLAPGTFYGIRKDVVTEFKIVPNLEIPLRRHRKWEVQEENMAFVPRGLGTGLAVRTGRKLIRLNRDDPIEDDFSYDTEKIIRGSFSEEFNTYLPGRKDSDLVVMKVGIRGDKRNLLAVASHEETSVKGSPDFIKMYEDVVAGKVFHKVPAYKPSSLVVLDFDNGETLLAFMEDESALQVYEYKGIEGFRHKLSAKMDGSKLVAMSAKGHSNERKFIAVIADNKISFVEAMMLGNQVEKNLQCYL